MLCIKLEISMFWYQDVCLLILFPATCYINIHETQMHLLFNAPAKPAHTLDYSENQWILNIRWCTTWVSRFLKACTLDLIMTVHVCLAQIHCEFYTSLVEDVSLTVYYIFKVEMEQIREYVSRFCCCLFKPYRGAINLFNIFPSYWRKLLYSGLRSVH